MGINNNISVIIPTYDRYEILEKNINNINSQNIEIKEIIICDDSNKNYFRENKDKLQKIQQCKNVIYKYCARFDIDGNKDYGLARARNFGIINCSSDIIVFLDDRLTPANQNSIETLTKKLINNKEKLWVFGNKGSDKKSFVENFSAIRKSNILKSGCFFERIDMYGGMTREVIARFSTQGYKFLYIQDALAEQLAKSSNWDVKEKQLINMRKFLEKNRMI